MATERHKKSGTKESYLWFVQILFTQVKKKQKNIKLTKKNWEKGEVKKDFLVKGKRDGPCELLWISKYCASFGFWILLLVAMAPDLGNKLSNGYKVVI